jgi:short-subunit dehydrogenase involved in D-alanine esterification of teichoic acids
MVEILSPENRLVIIGRDAGKLRALQLRFPSIQAVLCDLADLHAVDAVSRELAAGEDRFDVLICNAAVQHDAMFVDPGFRADLIGAEVATNFSSIALLVSRLLPKLREANGGAVISLINSGLAITPKKTSAVYCATKAALRSLAQSLRYQLAASQVRVAQAYLPLVDTAMTSGRGTGKMSPQAAAREIIAGIENETGENFVGKSKWLYRIHRVAPSLARKIVRKL